MKKRKSGRRSVQELMGIRGFTKYGLETVHGELLFFRVQPINISVHATDPALREAMLRHRRAGECLDIMKRFADAMSEVANVEKPAKLEGRTMLMFLAPKPVK